MAIDPFDNENWFYRGCILAYLDDTEAHRRHCAGMLAQLGDTKVHEVAERIVKTSLLLAGTTPDLKALTELIERALAGNG